MVFSCFDLQPKDKKLLKITRFNDPLIAPHIYSRFLCAYGKFPNNDEVPQYFVKMMIAEFWFNMDPDYTDTWSNFNGGGKVHTYEWTDARRDVQYRSLMPWLVHPHFRFIDLPEELETTSQIERGVREEIRDRVGAALAGVEFDLHTIETIISDL